jgi:hypothetical protein
MEQEPGFFAGYGGYDGLDPRPMRPREKPRAGEEYIDEAFGTRVTRISHAIPIDGENAIIKPMYSTVPAWSADEKYLLLWSRAHGHLLYQGDRPYRYIGPLDPYHPSDIESVLWSSRVEGGVYECFYPTNYNAEPVLYVHQIRPRRMVEPLKDFTRGPLFLPSGDWERILSLGGDPQWMSRESRTIGLRFGGDPALTFSYSLDDDEVIGQMELDPVYQNAVVPSPSGRWAQFGRGVYTPEMRLRRMLGMSEPYEHASPGLSWPRVDTWNMVDFSSERRQGSLVVYRLDTGTGRVVIGPENGYPYPPSGTHLSAIGPPGLVALGIAGTGQGQTLLDNEIVLADTRSGRVRRVAHARTLAGEGPWGYWAETHACISPSGTRIVWGSDWGGSDTVDTYVVDLREDRPDELEEEM